jgi:hypothetical protein
MAKGKTKFPFERVGGTIQGNDRTVGRNKGLMLTFSQRKSGRKK